MDEKKIDSTDLSVEDVRRWLSAIITAELEKGPADRDLDLIQECSDYEAELAEAEQGIGFERDVTGTWLCPGEPKLCLGNGSFPGIECCCDECDHYLKCFPEAMPSKADEPTA